MWQRSPMASPSGSRSTSRPRRSEMSVLHLNSRGARESRSELAQIQERRRELQAKLPEARRKHEKAVAAAEAGEGTVTAALEAAHEARNIEDELERLKDLHRQAVGDLAPGRGHSDLDPSHLITQFLDPEAGPRIREVAQSNGRFESFKIADIPGEVLARVMRSGGSL